MKITTVSACIISLPFRFSFKHNLASRNYSENIVARVIIEDNHGNRHLGFGESVPRDYVTGETAQSAVSAINDEYAAAFIGAEFDSGEQLLAKINDQFQALNLDRGRRGASWCALELALLDAGAKCKQARLVDWLGTVQPEHREGVVYGAVLPFVGRHVVTVLTFYRIFGFKTVKIKVGRNLEEDVELVATARRVLGESVKLRVDANCAWTAEQSIVAAERFRPFGVLSIEQPVKAEDLEGLARVTAHVPEQVLADESLCSVEQARLLASEQICSAFNIRISKVGGFMAAQEIARIARENNIAVHMGAQVGESGILSAAGRAFAAMHKPFENCEGSNNFFLLKQDITRENLNVGPGGRGKLLKSAGLGVTVLPERVSSLELANTTSPTSQATNQNAAV